MAKTNELKKGTRIELRNGFQATLLDSKKGNTRCAQVEGVIVESGSVYAYDIMYYLDGGVWHKVEHTPQQLRLKEQVKILFGG